MKLFEPTYNILKSKFVKWKNDPQLVIKLKKLNNKKSTLENREPRYEIIRSFLQDETVIESILKIIEISFNNLEEIFLNIPGIDKALYKSLTEFINAIILHNKIKSQEIIKSFYTNIFKEIDLFTILGSILIFQEKEEFEEALSSTDEIEYKKYLSDWILKYAQVIEGPLKNALLILLKLKLISQGKKYDNLDRRGISIGNVLNQLNTDQFLAKYRNAIFHQNVYLTKEHKIEFNKIVLYDRRKKITLSLDDFTNEFYKVFIFLITFYLVLFNNHLEFFHQPKNVLTNILNSVKDYLEKFKSNPQELSLPFK